MFISLLYVSAFLFFLADRRARHASLAGIAVTLLASIPFSWRTLFGGYKILNLAGQYIPDIDNYKRNTVCVVFAAFVTLLFSVILMALAKMWSRDLFRIPGDELKSRKMAKRLFIAASVIPGIVAVWLYAYKAVLFGIGNSRWAYYFITFFDGIGIDFLFIKREWSSGLPRNLLMLLKTANTVYAVLLFALSVLCIILINKKKFSYKDLSSSDHGTVSALPAAAITISLGGIITFLTIAQNGYIYWSSNYRTVIPFRPIYYSIIYGSYDDIAGKFTDTGRFAFCMIVLGVMAAGILILLISMIYMAVRKKIRKNLFSFLFSIVLILASSGCIYKMIAEIVKFHRI